MMKLRTLFLLAATSTLLACGSSDSTPDTGPAPGMDQMPEEGGEQIPEVDVQSGNLEGSYSVSVISVTALDKNGGTCGNGSGSLTITNGMIEGTAMSTNGVAYTIGGQLGDDGVVVGGAFAVSGSGAATYTGKFENGAGSGDWNDIYDCSGTWSASKG